MSEKPKRRPAVVMTSVAGLSRHPRAYRQHPADQIRHLTAVIREHGFTRHTTVARGGVILLGWDLVLAARELGMDKIPAVRLNLDADDPRALKVLADRHEAGSFDDVDDRALTELLKEIKETAPGGLQGTGYDDRMLANLLFVTRPKSEVRTLDAAAHWVGLPEYEYAKQPLKLTISFRSRADREALCRTLGIPHRDRLIVSGWYPLRDAEDVASLRFEG